MSTPTAAIPAQTTAQTPAQTTAQTPAVMSFIDGQWSVPRGPSHPIINPANGATLANVTYATTTDVDRAAKAAHKAFLEWREVPVVERVQPLYRYKALLEKYTKVKSFRRRLPKWPYG